MSCSYVACNRLSLNKSGGCEFESLEVPHNRNKSSGCEFESLEVPHNRSISFASTLGRLNDDGDAIGIPLGDSNSLFYGIYYYGFVIVL